MKTSYFEKLKDPRWQKKRLEVLNKANWTCQDCGSKETTFNVHHRYYVAHREPWEYPDFCFVALCENCHKDVTERTRRNSQLANQDWPRWVLFEPWEIALDTLGEEAVFEAARQFHALKEVV